MAFYRSWAHTRQDCRYHIVWITKYRRKWITADLEKEITSIIKEVCAEQYINIIRIGMEEDHVHLYVSIPLSHDIPKMIQLMKWRSSKKLGEMREYKDYFSKIYRKEWVWKWAVWYFVCTVWEVNDKLIKEYIESQWNDDSVDWKSTEVKV